MNRARAWLLPAAGLALAAGCATTPGAEGGGPRYALMGGTYPTPTPYHTPTPTPSPSPTVEACDCKITGDIKVTFASPPGTFGFEINTQGDHLIFQPPTTGATNQNVDLGDCAWDPLTQQATISTTEAVTFGGGSGILTFVIDTVDRGNHREGVAIDVSSPAGPLDFGASVTTENRGLNIFPDCD